MPKKIIRCVIIGPTDVQRFKFCFHKMIEQSGTEAHLGSLGPLFRELGGEEPWLSQDCMLNLFRMLPQIG